MARTDGLLAAVSFAARAHRNGLRKDGRTPYIAHPTRVMLILRHRFGVEDEEVLMAGVLHDTIEDAGVDRDDLIRAFGERVAAFVAALSKDKRLPRGERERQYLDTLAAAPVEVRLAKLADLFDNLTDSDSLSAKGREGYVHSAEGTVNRFADDMPAAWRHAIDLVRERIREVREEM